MNRTRTSKINDDGLLIDHIGHGALHIGHIDDDENELKIARSLWQHSSMGPLISTLPCLQYARSLRIKHNKIALFCLTLCFQNTYLL